MLNKFGCAFGDRPSDYLAGGEEIAAEIDGFDVTARIVPDWDTTPETADDPHYDPQIIADWENGKWHYCGIVLSVSRAGIELDPEADAAFGIEMNYPNPEGIDNSHLTDVANILLAGALREGRNAVARLMASYP